MMLKFFLLVLPLGAVYSWVRSRQHAALSDAYRFAHEQIHDTNRGYLPDLYTGMNAADCREIAKRFREVEDKWWMWGGRKQCARTERRIAECLAIHLLDHSSSEKEYR